MSEMSDTTAWDIRSAVKEAMQFAPLREDVVVMKVQENVDYSEEEIEAEIQEMIKDGTLFRPDQKNIQRT